MGLTDQELATWEVKNRAPLSKEKLNRWVFIVSRDAAATDEDLFRLLAAVVGRLQNKAADNFRLVRTSATAIAPQGGTVATREMVKQAPIPTVKPGPVTWAEVEFAWRSATPSVPWVAEKHGFITRETDPLDADVVLDSVGKPRGEVPPPKSTGDVLADAISDSVTKGALEGAGIVAAIVVGGWLLSKVGKR